MMQRIATLSMMAICLVACEDGPERVFTPNDGNPDQQNGYATTEPWVQAGEKGYEAGGAGGDNEGRARFCDEAMTTELIQWMVMQPVVPDQAAGGIPLWADDGGPLHVDSLLGVPNARAADGTWDPGFFCDPWYTYSNALTWGPLDDIIVFFEPDTRLVTDIQVIGQYLGTLAGRTEQAAGGSEVTLQLMERVQVDGRDLENYPQWATNETVTLMYGMIRQQFFGGEGLPEGFDCVTAKLCDVIFPQDHPSVPQPTYVLFQDSGVAIGFSEDGYLQFMDVEPVRVAPFEVSASLDFGDGTTLDPTFVSGNALLPSCRLQLADPMNWREFSASCVNEQALRRVNYVVHTARDAVDIEFNGVTLGFLHPTAEQGILADGASPSATDSLYSIGFSRSLNATVAEYVPHNLALDYKARLEARLNAAVASGAAVDHPFKTGNYAVAIPYADAIAGVPALAIEPQRIGELTYDGKSWVPEVVEAVKATYSGLSASQKAQVNPAMLNDVFLIEPFIDAVMGALTHGASDEAGVYKVFRTTDDRHWSIGRAHFMVDGEPYRLVVQYSLYYGAVTYVVLERGFSETDAVFNEANRWLGTVFGRPAPFQYYELWMSQLPADYNPFALGGSGIAVGESDRQLDMLHVQLVNSESYWDELPTSTTLIVPGYPIEDEAGYSRQIQGERYEFVLANQVDLYGKETSLRFYVEADGSIGRVVQYGFKGTLELCAGLEIAYGGSVRDRIIAWEATVGRDDYRDCELVFNYSENGNVLDSVASLRQKVSFTTIDGRAVSAAIWR